MLFHAWYYICERKNIFMIKKRMSHVCCSTPGTIMNIKRALCGISPRKSLCKRLMRRACAVGLCAALCGQLMLNTKPYAGPLFGPRPNFKTEHMPECFMLALWNALCGALWGVPTMSRWPGLSPHHEYYPTAEQDYHNHHHHIMMLMRGFLRIKLLWVIGGLMQYKALHKATLRKKLYELYAGWDAARECRKKALWTFFFDCFFLL